MWECEALRTNKFQSLHFYTTVRGAPVIFHYINVLELNCLAGIHIVLLWSSSRALPNSDGPLVMGGRFQGFSRSGPCFDLFLI